MSRKAALLIDILFGGIAGLLTGVIVMLLWTHTSFLPPMIYMFVLDQMKVYETIAKAYGVQKMSIIHVCHFFTSAVLGILFVLIFKKHVLTLFKGVWLGAIFGVIWWLLTPFYLMPLFFSVPTHFRWGDANLWGMMNAVFGHIIFGILIGLFYALLKKFIRHEQ